MKKILFITITSLFVFAGCGESELKKSEELVNSESYSSGFYTFVDEETLIESIKYNAVSLGYDAVMTELIEYKSIMSEKVDSVNANGGATGDVYTVGNATIGKINDLITYLSENSGDSFDVAYAYGELIAIRDNMKSIGFI